MVTMIPARSWFAPGEPIVLTFDQQLDQDAVVRVWSLATLVLEQLVPAGQTGVTLHTDRLGGFGVTLHDAADTAQASTVRASTAFDVLHDPFERPRYGFLVRMTEETPVADISRLYRRLHLNLAQFYDWAWRHSTLMPPQNEYLDPLGQARSLTHVDRIATAFRAIGTVPLGYSAVYAIGHDELDAWREQVLYREDGEPFRLGENFLVLVDPSDPVWLEHYTAQLRAVMEGTALAGFHLDQYGWPKVARGHDGRRIDLSVAHRRMLEAVREAVPESRFMFNNVNDFPTWATADAPQDASYIEVWPPHSTLGDLALLAERTRVLRPEHPPILSAYLSCFRQSHEGGVNAAKLAMAAIFSNGGTHLLLGEESGVLTDPYYPNYETLGADLIEQFVPWYDFLVRYGDLLLAPGLQPVTEYFSGGINEDVLLVTPDGLPASTKAEAGSIWVQVVRTAEGGHVVHLINLSGLSETEWDAVKPDQPELSGLVLKIVPALADAGVLWASPDSPDQAGMIALQGARVEGSDQTDALSAGQEHLDVPLPPLKTWAMIYLPATPEAA